MSFPDCGRAIKNSMARLYFTRSLPSFSLSVCVKHANNKEGKVRTKWQNKENKHKPFHGKMCIDLVLWK